MKGWEGEKLKFKDTVTSEKSMLHTFWDLVQQNVFNDTH